ncbi:hypothetical protein M0Q50_07795 [bacterium]|jgi:protein involved in sex pheromone biosynthesis|nr:hypothetical protein [bacterium]
MENEKQVENINSNNEKLLLSDVIHRNSYLSKSDIDLLKLKGFAQDISKNSGYYFIEDDKKTMVLIPYEDGSYKLEFYEMCDDGDGNYYEDYDKEYSKDVQTLDDFINFWVD